MFVACLLFVLLFISKGFLYIDCVLGNFELVYDFLKKKGKIVSMMYILLLASKGRNTTELDLVHAVSTTSS